MGGSTGDILSPVNELYDTGIEVAEDAVGDLWPSASSKDSNLSQIDYSTWSSDDLAFVKAHENILTMYQSGNLRASPTEFYGGNLATLAEKTFGVSKTDYESWIEQRHSALLAEQQPILDVASYTGDYSMYDPTPWDNELSASDLAWQSEQTATWLGEQEAIAIAEREVEIEAARLEQEGIDLEEFTNLASLRGQSEVLAQEDVKEYIAETSQQLKLRGVTPSFTDEQQEELVQGRFTEYWSQENETRLMELATQFQGRTDLDLPTISERVWSKGDTTIEQVDYMTPSTETAATGQAVLLEQALLDAEEEVLGQISLLGG